MKIPGLIVIVATSLFLVACANQIAPSGGEKDTTPPSIIREVPANKTTDFSYSTIYIGFDEFIQFAYPNPAFAITPALPTPPEVTVKNKSITLTLPDSLLPNTTYQINFGSSIKDLNENNALENYTYVFSTGPFIDSLQYKVKVIGAASNQPVANTTIGLYQAHWSDSLITTKKPTYYTTTNDAGEALFSYLKKDSFQVVAFKDHNSDNVFQPASEGVGFFSIPKYSVKDAALEMLKFSSPSALDFTAQYQQKASGHLTITTSRPLKKENINPINLSTYTIIPLSPDSLDLFFSPADIASDTLIIEATSQAGDSIIDTLPLRKFPAGDSTFALPPPAYDFRNDTLFISFPQSIPLIAGSQAVLTIQQGTTIDTITPSNSTPLLYAISPIPYGDTLRVNLYKSLLTNWLNKKNRAFSTTYLVPKKTTFGQLQVSVDSALLAQSTPIIGQLLDSKGLPVAAVQNMTSWKLDHLLPGEYSIRLILDENHNGYWDKGRYATRMQPETIIFYPDPITIRSNWENNIKITFP